MGAIRAIRSAVAEHRSLALWLAYLVVPVAGWGWFEGRPASLASLCAMAVVAWLSYARRRIGLVPLVAAALALKVALGAPLLLPRGFDARYFANATFSEPIERGSEPASAGFTRVDRALAFIPRERDLPQYFFNDVQRFNFAVSDRETLPASASWHGWLRVRDAGPQMLYLRASGATVTLSVGSKPIATLTPSDKTWSGVAPLSAGYEPIVVTAAMPRGVARHVEVGRIVAGREVPLDAGDVFRATASPLRHALDEGLRMLASLVDAVLCAWLAFRTATTLRESWRGLRAGNRVRAGLVLGWALVIADVAVFALPLAHRAIILSGGDDWLTYASFARDIAINGIWMTQGTPLGQGQPFYFQPFYPYFVAACHWLAGDSLLGVYFAQRLLAGATAIALWRLTATLFGERIGCAGLLAAVALVYTKLEPWTRVLLSESLFVPAIAILVCLLARLATVREPRPAVAALAGIVGGIATLTRTSLLLGWGLVVPLVAWALARRPRGWTTLGVFIVALAAITSLAAVRNWVVSHKFVATATSGSVVLKLGNTPKAPLVIPEARRAQYAQQGLDANLQDVVEYLRQRPLEFFGGWLDKAAYTLGWFGAMLPERTAWFYVIAWVLALGGIVLLVPTPSAAPWPARLLPLAFALSIFATLVVFLPHVYGDRMILPLYAMLVPYAALPLERAYRWLAQPRVDLAGVASWLAALAATAGVFWFGDRTVLVALGTLAVGALCVAPPPALSVRVLAPWLPLAVAMLALFVAKPALAEASARAHWLMLASAIVAGAHVQSRRGIVVAASVVAAGLASIALYRLSGAGLAALATGSGGLLQGSLRYADFAPVAGALGIACLGVAWMLRARARPSAIAAYAAGTALAIGALQAPAADAAFSWALMRSVASVLGVAGAAAYALAWAWAAWPGRLASIGSDLPVRLIQGVVLGLFVAGQAGAGVRSLEVGPLVVFAALLFAAIEAHRRGPATREAGAARGFGVASASFR